MQCVERHTSTFQTTIPSNDTETIPVKVPKIHSDFTGFTGCSEPLAANTSTGGGVTTLPPSGLQVRSLALAANNLSDYVTASEFTSDKPIYRVMRLVPHSSATAAPWHDVLAPTAPRQG